MSFAGGERLRQLPTQKALLTLAVLPACCAALTLSGMAPPGVRGAARNAMGPENVTGLWPEGLSLEPFDPMPRAQWNPASASAEWAHGQHAWRQGMMGRTDAWAESLNSVFADDAGGAGGDSSLWVNISELVPPQDGSFWKAVCNGTNATVVAALKGLPDRPLHGWNVKNNTDCSDQLPGEYTDEATAEKECGTGCSAVIDVGCERQQFRLCKLGAVDQPSTNSTCLRMRLPDHRPSESKPIKPMELEFWKAFCTKAGVAFRMLFPDRLCEAGKTLEGAYSEGRCAELAANETECSDVFDFEEATPPVCRCATTGTPCNAKLAKETGLSRNVFIRVYANASA